MNTLLYSVGYYPVVGISLLTMVYCYGAAKLSYNYNIYTNNSGYAFLWAILCYFFAFLYYPYYAIFLNPLPGLVRLR